MNTGALIRGGVTGGLLAGVLLAAAGRLLGLAIPPWSYTASADGFIGRAMEWMVIVAALVPAGAVAGIVVGLVCAVAFEYVTERAGWLPGAIVGLMLGVCAASAVGLMPWLAFRFGYVYLPPFAPFGSHDPSWPLVMLAAVVTLNGAVAGAMYGRPRHGTSSRPPTKWRQVYPFPSSDV
jgi:hypothetical protein